MARVQRIDLRGRVIERAKKRCEYCQLPDDDGWAIHEVDHVIARKHGGKTILSNLAYACIPCNRHKGTDISSIEPQTGQVIQLFNPRTQRWGTHFQLHPDGTITSRTAVGRVTALLLHFNDPIRMQIRADSIATGKLNPRTTLRANGQI